MKDGVKDWEGYAKLLGTKIDWKRDGAIWQDNIVQGGRLLTARGPLDRAFKAIATEIGLVVDRKTTPAT